MSPEQCRGRAVDRRSDVFALGTILYELTTGAAPFTGDSDLEILNRIATGVAAPPAWPEDKGVYPTALSDIVMRALAPDPDHRFPTMQALQVALETFAREASIPVSTVALGGLMQRLFADELAAWQEAQRAGKSLGEHLAGRPAVVRSAGAEERTATDAFGPTRRRATRGRKWARGLALTVFAAVFALAGGLGGEEMENRSRARAGASGRAARVSGRAAGGRRPRAAAARHEAAGGRQGRRCRGGPNTYRRGAIAPAPGQARARRDGDTTPRPGVTPPHLGPRFPEGTINEGAIAIHEGASVSARRCPRLSTALWQGHNVDGPFSVGIHLDRST